MAATTNNDRPASRDSEKHCFSRNAHNIVALWDLEEDAKWSVAWLQARRGAEEMCADWKLFRPSPQSPGHATLVGLHFGRRKSSRASKKMATAQRTGMRGASMERRASRTYHSISTHCWLARCEGTPSVKPIGSRWLEGTALCPVARSGNLPHGSVWLMV